MTTARDAAIAALRPYVEKLAEHMPQAAINIGEIADAVLAELDDPAVLKLPRYYQRDEDTTAYLLSTEDNGDAVAFAIDTSADIDLVKLQLLLRPAGNPDYTPVAMFHVNHDNLRNFALAALAAIGDQHARNQR
jgi:hypothetical protein